MTAISVLIVLLSACLSTNREFAEDSLRATVRIKAGSTSGTGFFVEIEDESEARKRYLLVTAAHVLENMRGKRCTVIFRAPDQGEGFARVEAELAIREGEKPLWVQHPEADVAVIAMEPPEGVDLGAFDFKRIAGTKFAEDRKVHVGQEVCIPCYPVQVEANLAGWPILRKGSIATHPLTPLSKAKTIFVDYNHFGGDSGAPVVAWIDEEAVVVGLVIAMQRQTSKISTPFEERTVHTPLDLAIAVQSPYVRQTIDRWRERNQDVEDSNREDESAGN